MEKAKKLWISWTIEPLLKTFAFNMFTKISNTFIWLISQGEPEKIASVVKPKTCRALGIAVVGFVGDHLRDKKATEFNTLD